MTSPVDVEQLQAELESIRGQRDELLGLVESQRLAIKTLTDAWGTFQREEAERIRHRRPAGSAK